MLASVVGTSNTPLMVVVVMVMVVVVVVVVVAVMVMATHSLRSRPASQARKCILASAPRFWGHCHRCRCSQQAIEPLRRSCRPLRAKS